MINKISSLKVVLICLVLSFLSLNLHAQSHSYIDKNKDMANELSIKYGIPSSVILAVAFVESGAGTSKNAKILKNHFGIVGKNTVNRSRYRSFKSVRASYEAFCKLLSRKKYYARLKGKKNFSEWVHAIAEAGYTTVPKEWIRRVTFVNKKFNLSRLD